MPVHIVRVALSKIYDKANTCLLPYGYEFNSDTAHHKSEQKSELIFGFLGRIDMYTKGLDLMLSAFADKAKNHNEAKLWIIGDGDDRSILESKVKELKIEQKVVFWGAKFGEEKNDLLKGIDVFLHPSRNEGYQSL